VLDPMGRKFTSSWENTDTPLMINEFSLCLYSALGAVNTFNPNIRDNLNVFGLQVALFQDNCDESSLYTFGAARS